MQIAVAISLGVAILSISGESLWIDEAHTAAKAGQPNFFSWWETMLGDSGSDLQMPLYMFYVWSWSLLFGDSEIALRSANVLPFLLAQFALWRSFLPTYRRSLAIVAVSGVSPFVWYYMNEARPYMMQYAGASLAVWGFLMIREGSAKNAEGILTLGAGLIVVAGSSALGMPWAVAALVAVLLKLFKGIRGVNGANQLGYVLVILVGLTLIIVYDFWSFTRGGEASDAAGTSVESVIFGIYEILGFAGLGPGRLDLRSQGASSLLPYAGQLAVLAVAFTVAFLMAGRNWVSSPERRKLVVRLLLSVFLVSIVMFLIGILAGFRLLGRHFTPVVPLVMVAVGCTVFILFKRRELLPRLAALLLLTTLVVSSLSLRLDPRHRKDDYRQAAASARLTVRAGGTVWWAADQAGASYYGLHTGSKAALENESLYLPNPTSSDLNDRAAPDMVVISRPDLFDHRGFLRRYVRVNHYSLVAVPPAFQIWRR